MKKPPRGSRRQSHFVTGLLAAVDDDLRARLHPRRYSRAPAPGGLGDQGPVVGLRDRAVADRRVLDALGEPRSQPICDSSPTGPRDADRHAALRRRCRSRRRSGRRPPDPDRRPASRSCGSWRRRSTGRAFRSRGGGRIDVLRDVGAADEADGLDVGVGQDGVDGLLVALHHLKTPAAGRPR